MSALPGLPGGAPMQPPSLAGQVQVLAATVNVATVDQTGQRALIIVPQGTALQLVVPLDDDAAQTIGGALLAKHVVMPGADGLPHV